MSRAAEWRIAERVGALFAQLFFIAAGVYLGSRADAWKEERGHREAARVTLEKFYTDASGSTEPALMRQYGALIPKLDTAIARAGK